MNEIYTLYSRFDGSVLGVGNLQTFNRMGLPDESTGVVPGRHMMYDSYVDLETELPMPKMLMCITVNGNVIEGVPEGSTFYVSEVGDSQVVIQADTVLELSENGMYNIGISHPKYHPYTLLFELK